MERSERNGMEHIYPTFERGRIMKKESLWALRDYSYTALSLQYQEYADGIISGCGLRAEGNDLCIGAGIIKCRGFIYLLSDKKIPCPPTNRMQYLKFATRERQELPDYIKYEAEVRLEDEAEKDAGEIELCRFKLREGFQLRTEYKDFFDIQTEYDTVNLADARWSGRGGATLSRQITDFYARKVLECATAEDMDIQFAYMALQSRDAVSREVLTDYLARKGWEADDGTEWTNGWMFTCLENALEQIRSGHKAGGKHRADSTDRMIILD